MGQLLGQSQRLQTPTHGLCRITQIPQRQGGIEKASHSWRRTLVEIEGPLRLWIDKGNSLLKMYPGSSEFA